MRVLAPYFYILILVLCFVGAASVNAGRAALTEEPLCQRTWPDSGLETWIATKLDKPEEIADVAKAMQLLEESGYFPQQVIEVTEYGELSCLVILSRRMELPE